MTKYEMTVAIGSAFDLPVNHILPDNSMPSESSVKRPYDTHLASDRLEAVGIGRRTLFHDGIVECLKPLCI